MSLNATPALVKKASDDQMTDQDFIDCVRQSLPSAWNILDQLASELKSNDQLTWTKHAPLHMDDKDRGQLLRLMASSSMRAAVESFFGLKFEFQNCHITAAFRPSTIHSLEYNTFVSPKSQILAQRPELQDC